MRKHRRKTQPALPSHVTMGNPHRSFPDSPVLSHLPSQHRRSTNLQPKTSTSVCQNAERESAAGQMSQGIATKEILFARANSTMIVIM